MTRQIKAQKIRAKLAQMASKNSDFSINDLRLIVALERVVARIETIPKLADHLIFKGGFVLLKTLETHRFTRDLDAVALSLSKDEIPDLIQQALKTDLQDGFWYGEAEIDELSSKNPYGGWQMIAPYQIGDPPALSKGGMKKLSRIQIDIGIGDKIPKDLPRSTMPALSFGEPVSWIVYPPEYIFSEKLEALFSRGSASSRAKDIYDLVLLFPNCSDLELLKTAIRETFEHRETPIPFSFF